MEKQLPILKANVKRVAGIAHAHILIQVTDLFPSLQNKALQRGNFFVFSLPELIHTTL